ncbi:MAG: GGDEF domain-containing protein [Treponema sp.]|nr:GGDEF domain-containing protein [Treponema sp.]
MNKKKQLSKKELYYFEKNVAYLLGIIGCVSNGLGLATTVFFNLYSKVVSVQALLFTIAPISISFTINLVLFIRLVIKKKEYVKFMRASVILNGLFCFPMMLHNIGNGFFRYYYILAVLAGLCFVNRSYCIIISLIIVIADIIMFNSSANGMKPALSMKAEVDSTISFVAVSLLTYFFNKENMRDKKVLKDHEKTLKNLAARDVLTSAYNRRMFDEDSKMNDFKYIIMIDIDHFKQVNDTYGHQVGDQVLKDLVELLHDDRCYEFQVYRYGGEEFAILSMYDSKKTQALLSKFVENVRKSLTIGKSGQPVTVSCGISEKIASQGLKYIIRDADTQLYKAKDSGRNCVFYKDAKIM